LYRSASSTQFKLLASAGYKN